MAEVIVAREAGACYGVERALDMVLAASEEGSPLYTLGPLIHNPVVVGDLESRGVHVVDDPSSVPAGSTLVLRTHGVTPEIEDAARDSGVVVLDATCPFVKRAHRAAERLEREDYQVLLVGEVGHPEVEGTLGHAPHATVVESVADLETLTLGRKVGIVVQTTMAHDKLRAIVAAIVGRTDELRVIDTICEATAGHQDACAELASTVDVMVVVGGKNSANTTHLAEIASANCPHTHHIETPDELEGAWFDGADRIGLTAGASTPAAHIEAVRDAILALVKA